MKNYIFSFILFTLTFSLSNTGHCDFRTFHDVSGRAIEAKLIQFEPRTEMVKVELKNETVKSVKASIFSTEDQSYIRGWHTLDSLVCKMQEDFSEKQTVKVIFDPRRRDEWQPTNMIFKNVVYELELRNTSGQSCRNLNVEYCIQYESKVRESKGYRGNGGWYGNHDIPFQTTTNTFFGTWFIPECMGNQKLQHTTEALLLKDGLESNLEPDGKIQWSRRTQDRLIGICLRLTTTLDSGAAVSKEITSADGLPGRVNWETACSN